MEGNTWFLIKLFGLLSLTAVLFSLFGWWLRCKLGKCGATKAELDAAIARASLLEGRLSKAESDAKSSAAALASLKESAIDRKAAAAELAAIQQSLNAEKELNGSLSIQLKKAREATIAAEAKINEAGKSVQARAFDLENQLSKAREEAGRAQQAAEQARAALAEHKASNSSGTEELKNLENQILGFRAQANKARQTTEEAQAARDAAIADLAIARDNVTRLTTELAEAKAKAGVPHDPNAPSEDQLKVLRGAIARAQQEREAAVAAHRADVADLRQQLAAATSAAPVVASLAPANDESAAALQSAKDAEAAAQARATELGARVQTLESELASIKASTNETTTAAPLAEKLTELQSERDSLNAQLSLLKTNLEDSVAYRTGEKPADDLKEIKGVAEVLNAKLNAYGVFTYRQIVAWTPEEVDAFGALISFKDRIRREDWQGQCREFHKAKYGEELPPSPGAPS